jgi:hypothetical protein
MPLLAPAQAPHASSVGTTAPAASANVPEPAFPTPKYPESPAGILGDRLQLTPTQQAYWADYIAKIDGYTKVFYQEKPASAFKAEAAPRQIGRMIDKLQNQLAALDEVETSAKALYSILTTAQRQTADEWLLSTVPVFSTANLDLCPPTKDGNSRPEKRDAGQRKRHPGGMGG